MTDTLETTRQRVRVLYEKGEAIKFISHQDEFRLWERTLRRADLPLLFKQGFNPQPHMQFAAPLGVGITGKAEYVDFVLEPSAPLDEIAARLRAKLPPGVVLHGLWETPFNAPSLQNLVIGSDYTITLYATLDELGEEAVVAGIATLLAADQVWLTRQRKGELYDYNLRPLIFELRYDGYDRNREEHSIFLRVQQRSGATGRPDEVLKAMGMDDVARSLRRDRLFFADVAEDVALFSVYPVVEQASIARPDGERRRKKPRHATPVSAPQAQRKDRTINERAGDEFA